MGSFSSEGALWPISGAEERGVEAGAGENQEWISCWKVILLRRDRCCWDYGIGLADCIQEELKPKLGRGFEGERFMMR